MFALMLATKTAVRILKIAKVMGAVAPLCFSIQALKDGCSDKERK